MKFLLPVIIAISITCEIEYLNTKIQEIEKEINPILLNIADDNFSTKTMSKDCFVAPVSPSKVEYSASKTWIKLFNALFYYSVKKNEVNPSTGETILEEALFSVESHYESIAESLAVLRLAPTNDHKCLKENDKCPLTDEEITKIFVKEYEKNCFFTKGFAEKYKGDNTIRDVTINYCCDKKFGLMYEGIETDLHIFLDKYLNDFSSLVNLIKLFYLKIAKKIIENKNADEFKLRYFLVFERAADCSNSYALNPILLKNALKDVSDYQNILLEKLGELEPKPDLEAIKKDLDLLKDIKENFSKNIIQETFKKLRSEFLPFGDNILI